MSCFKCSVQPMTSITLPRGIELQIIKGKLSAKSCLIPWTNIIGSITNISINIRQTFSYHCHFSMDLIVSITERCLCTISMHQYISPPPAFMEYSEMTLKFPHPCDFYNVLCQRLLQRPEKAFEHFFKS